MGAVGAARKTDNTPPTRQAVTILQIEARTIRDGGTTSKGYHADLFADAFSRYLAPSDTPSLLESPLSMSHIVTTGPSTGDSPLLGLVTDPSCDYSKNGTNPAPRADCDDVTAHNGLFPGEEDIWEDNHAH